MSIADGDYFTLCFFWGTNNGTSSFTTSSVALSNNGTGGGTFISNWSHDSPQPTPTQLAALNLTAARIAYARSLRLGAASAYWQRLKALTLTTSDRNLIAAPPQGSLVFNSTLNLLELYDGSQWNDCVFSNSTYPMTSGSISVGAISSSGTFSNGTNSMTTGSLFSSSMSAGTNSLTVGAITSSGTFSNGTNSMTTGVLSASSISLSAPNALIYTGSGTQSIATSTHADLKIWDTKSYSTGSITYNGSTGGFTVPVAGLYGISSYVSWATATDASNRVISICVNGAMVVEDSRINVGSGYPTSFTVSATPIKLSANDVITINAWNDVPTIGATIGGNSTPARIQIYQLP